MLHGFYKSQELFKLQRMVHAANQLVVTVRSFATMGAARTCKKDQLKSLHRSEIVTQKGTWSQIKCIALGSFIRLKKNVKRMLARKKLHPICCIRQRKSCWGNCREMFLWKGGPHAGRKLHETIQCIITPTKNHNKIFLSKPTPKLAEWSNLNHTRFCKSLQYNKHPKLIL